MVCWSVGLRHSEHPDALVLAGVFNLAAAKCLTCFDATLAYECIEYLWMVLMSLGAPHVEELVVRERTLDKDVLEDTLIVDQDLRGPEDVLRNAVGVAKDVHHKQQGKAQKSWLDEFPHTNKLKRCPK